MQVWRDVTVKGFWLNVVRCCLLSNLGVLGVASSGGRPHSEVTLVVSCLEYIDACAVAGQSAACTEGEEAQGDHG